MIERLHHETEFSGNNKRMQFYQALERAMQMATSPVAVGYRREIHETLSERDEIVFDEEEEAEE